jgi:hypothetical protein
MNLSLEGCGYALGNKFHYAFIINLQKGGWWIRYGGYGNNQIAVLEIVMNGG